MTTEETSFESVQPFDQHAVPVPADDWLLVVCGPSRPGNRRARRLAADASRLGLDVVWFDGFDERVDRVRVPLDSDDLAAPIHVIVCAETFGRSDARTLRRRIAATLERPELPTPLRRAGAVLRKSAAIGRPRRHWQVLRPAIEALVATSEPIGVVPCDDSGFVVAWNVMRRWPAVRPVTTVEEVRRCMSGS